MSRTKRTYQGKKFNDGQPMFHRCKCDSCMNLKWKTRNGITVEESLKLMPYEN